MNDLPLPPPWPILAVLLVVLLALDLLIDHDQPDCSFNDTQRCKCHKGSEDL